MWYLSPKHMRTCFLLHECVGSQVPWSSSGVMLTQNARDWGLISPWSTEFSFWLLIITNSTTYIWWPLRSLSLKHMRICFLLEGMNVIVVKCLDSLVVSCSPRMQETGDQFPIELQNFFWLLIVTNSTHCYKGTYPVHPWHNTLGECQQQCVIYTLPVGITILRLPANIKSTIIEVDFSTLCNATQVQWRKRFWFPFSVNMMLSKCYWWSTRPV